MTLSYLWLKLSILCRVVRYGDETCADSCYWFTWKLEGEREAMRVSDIERGLVLNCDSGVQHSYILSPIFMESV